MSDAALRDAMVRMATDTDFARRVHDDGPAVAFEIGLSDAELASLQALEQSETTGGPSRMGERLSKSGLFGAGAIASALHLGAGGDAHGFLCNGHAGIQCDGHAGIQCNGHALPKGTHSLLCNGHAGIQCNGHASLQCNEHVSLQCNEHALPKGTHSLLCDGHTSIQCNDHASLQCNDHDGHTEVGVVKCNAHVDVQTAVDVKGAADLHPPVLGQVGVHSLLPPSK